MKPGDFYVGVISFFAILVPGAIGVAVLISLPQPVLRESVFSPLFTNETDATVKWAAFAISAYFLGHLLFFIGSFLDRLYNEVRKILHPYDNESAFSGAERIRNSMINDSEYEALNVFQWSRAILTAFFPAAASDVYELEADSKFFRSLIVVLVVGAGVFLQGGRPVEGLVSLALVVPCFMRYYERRLKSTTQAYRYVITLHRLGKLKSLPNAAEAKSS